MKQIIIKDSNPSMTMMSFNKWIINTLINCWFLRPGPSTNPIRLPTNGGVWFFCSQLEKKLTLTQ